MPPTPRRAVQLMPEYHPPLDGRTALRLDFNENTFSPSPRVLDHIHAITLEGLTKYPERASVEAIVARKYGFAPDQVLLTNGVDEAIHTTCLAFLDPGDECLIATPGFFMYDISASIMLTEGLVRIQSDASLTFPFERMLAAITPRTKLIMVASPNNPTGAIISRDQLLALAAAAPQAVLFVDEAYYHFFGETTFGDVGHIPNLLVARTFSKAYGLANLRVGMVAGPAELIGYLKKVSSPYNVNGVALDVLPAALADDDYLDWFVAEVRQGRERMAQGLDALGVEYFPSEANYLLMKIGEQHREFVASMRTHGVLVRDRSSDPGCDGYVRITIGVADQVKQGLAAVALALNDIHWQKLPAHDNQTVLAGEREYE